MFNFPKGPIIPSGPVPRCTPSRPERLEIVLEALKWIQEMGLAHDGLRDLNYLNIGLCAMVPWVIGNITSNRYPGDPEFGYSVSCWAASEWRIICDPLFKRWPEFSGDIKYPVTHPATVRSDAAYHSTRLKWGVSEYGLTRLRLVDFLIEQLTPQSTVS